MHFTEEHFELKSTTEATIGPTKQTWYIFHRIWSGKRHLSCYFSVRLAVAVKVELPQPLKQLQMVIQDRQRTKTDIQKERSWVRNDITT